MPWTTPGSLQSNWWWKMLFQRNFKENFVTCLRNQKGLGDLTSYKRQLSHHQPRNIFVLKALARTISVLPACIPPLISYSLKKIIKKSNWMKKLEKEWNPVCLLDTLDDTVAMVTSSTTELLYLWFFLFCLNVYKKKIEFFVPSSPPV